MWLGTPKAGFLLLVTFFILSGVCGCKPTPAPTVVKQAEEQSGQASWYGHPFDGRLTASGEVYNMEALTAAHRTLPFGTVLHVIDLDTGKTIDVRVNDRGPFVAGRIIDLSHAAAQSVAMPAVARVKLQVITRPKTRGVETYAVQIGAFAARSDAAALTQVMQARFGTAKTYFRGGDQTWRVLVGMSPTIEEAAALQQAIGESSGPTFVVAVDSTP